MWNSGRPAGLSSCIDSTPTFFLCCSARRCNPVHVPQNPGDSILRAVISFWELIHGALRVPQQHSATESDLFSRAVIPGPDLWGKRTTGSQFPVFQGCCAIHPPPLSTPQRCSRHSHQPILLLSGPPAIPLTDITFLTSTLTSLDDLPPADLPSTAAALRPFAESRPTFIQDEAGHKYWRSTKVSILQCRARTRRLWLAT